MLRSKQRNEGPKGEGQRRSFRREVHGTERKDKPKLTGPGGYNRHSQVPLAGDDDCIEDGDCRNRKANDGPVLFSGYWIDVLQKGNPTGF